MYVQQDKTSEFHPIFSPYPLPMTTKIAINCLPTHQPKLLIPSQRRNRLLPLYVALDYHPSVNLGGLKSSRNLHGCWERGMLTLLPAMRALVPSFLQLGELSSLTDASSSTGSHFEKIISSVRTCCHVPGPANRLQPRGALSSQHKVTVMFHHGKISKATVRGLMEPALSTLQNQSTLIKVSFILL